VLQDVVRAEDRSGMWPVSEERCPERFAGDGGAPLPCRREAGRPGFHQATDQVWWTKDTDLATDVWDALKEVGYEVEELP
jgi:hypothetical protein